ncbi:hypothetical protein SUDANB58_02766 [Streptomyces sp. enrichment culture]|uniref:DUF3073 domain-containing protein n=1 Tax=Streptomyces sp. enrichment culture TaxID=1795815 RepID=UPI003F56AF20
MGRGRAKAKQTKVARQLKYNSGGTDLARLAEELGASTANASPSGGERFQDDEHDDDLYAKYADLYEDDDEDGDSQSPQQRRGA